MIHEHFTHLRIEKVEANENIVHLAGTLGNVRRLAFSLGFEVVQTNHPIVEMDGINAIHNTQIVSSYELQDYDRKNRALIVKTGKNEWTLQISRTVYNSEFANSFCPQVS